MADHPADSPTAWELARAGLDELPLTDHGRPREDWKAAVIRWHLQAMAAAESEAWIPALTRRQNAEIEQLLGRFYGHHIKRVVGRLVTENNDLKARLMGALECLRFYAAGSADTGARATIVLQQLLRRDAEPATPAPPLAALQRNNKSASTKDLQGHKTSS